jgi:hypothetical protein
MTHSSTDSSTHHDELEARARLTLKVLASAGQMSWDENLKRYRSSLQVLREDPAACEAKQEYKRRHSITASSEDSIAKRDRRERKRRRRAEMKELEVRNSE